MRGFVLLPARPFLSLLWPPPPSLFVVLCVASLNRRPHKHVAWKQHVMDCHGWMHLLGLDYGQINDGVLLSAPCPRGTKAVHE